MLIDTFSWEPYEQALLERKRVLPEVMTKRNKAVADTKNFYAVIGSGAFIPGHLLVIPKKLIFAFASLPDDQVEEADWFLNKMERIVQKTYGLKTIIAEHGMCHTPPSERKHYDHAHVHLFTLSPHVTEQGLTKAIDFTLARRAPAVTEICLEGKTYTKADEISEQFRRAAMEGVAPNTLSFKGKLLTLTDVQQYAMDDLVLSGRTPMSHAGMYTYFKTPWASNSFMTHYDLQSQITRHIVFNAERGIDTWEKDGGTMEWRWQENPFWERMVQTMRDIAPAMQEIESEPEARRFAFRNGVILPPNKHKTNGVVRQAHP
ncbi:MAG: hypothetical protein RBT70_04770 [Alphaproteobacteria bacterium]|jgi:diadenosine tetraphosphate (Ap4A) HIT family hydrolase|nr:hypothetical protein [Alphaproteobacteria bacterium]